MDITTGIGRSRGPAVGAVAALLLAGVVACTETPTGAELQKIEEVTFAPSLGIDLADFTQLATGVYYRDDALGPVNATPATYGTTPTISFTGWLVDGTVFAEGSIRFFMGNFEIPLGLEEGLLNQRIGGTRTIIVPPERGLGGVDQVHEEGVIVVPGGSVLVYEVVVDTVEG